MKKLLCLGVLFFLTGCGTVHTYPLPDYRTMTLDDIKEIPITQANFDWIVSACPSGNFGTDLQKLVATPEGLVIRKIRCYPEEKTETEGTTKIAARFTVLQAPKEN